MTTNLHSIVMCANVLVRKGNQYLMLRRSPEKEHLANFLHTIGGKIDPMEEPMTAAIRELKEEAGLEVTNIRLEAIVTEILPEDTPKYKDMPQWLIFYFSGDYVTGDVTSTEEGELIWLTADEIRKQDMFPSMRLIFDDMIDPHKGTIFVKTIYDKDLNIVQQQVTACEK